MPSSTCWPWLYSTLLCSALHRLPCYSEQPLFGKIVLCWEGLGAQPAASTKGKSPVTESQAHPDVLRLI